jgi:serine protease Do
MTDISSVLKNILPAVVLIEPEKSQRKNSSEKTLKVEGGSGFIVSKNGLIITNRHNVPDKSQRYFAITYDNKKYPLKILSRNSENDVAILKISSKEIFPFVKLGDSSKLELGEEVFAIGNSLGFKDTISQGIISGLNREVGNIKDLIQTDAAINPGNSGGPLINDKGEVIGINSVMVFEAENIGFAIPINKAKKDLKDVKEYGRVRRPFLGFNYIDQRKGALVVEVKDFLKNDLKENDIILECNGQKITEDFQLEDCLKALEIGETAKFKIKRKKEIREIEIPIKEKI